MKKLLLTIALALLLPAMQSFSVIGQEREFKLKDSPRLYIDKAVIKSVQKSVKKDAYWAGVDAMIMKEAEAIFAQPYTQYKLVGRRMLGVSRETISRVLFLSYAYWTTGEERYAERAEREMLEAAKFDNWNQSHFLDVAEMTAALGLGYDWLYNYMSEESKTIIADAIIEKGLKISLIKDHYKKWNLDKNNWNQVCHTGLSLGAIAVWERNPDVCQQVVDRAITNIQIPMANYNPDGAFAEGPGYWEYGTLFNVLLLDALDSAFGHDFGLVENHPGFQKTSEYICNVITPNRNLCNFGDNSLKASFNIAPFWFAKRFNNEANLYPLFGANAESQRFLPMALIWGHRFSSTSGKHPEAKMWVADGEIPIAVMRSEWGNKDAQFVAVKLGTCAVSHSHLDIGSFIYEADGVRWATDLGSEDYTKIEQANVDLWGRAADAQRWDIYRYNNGQHNVFTINNRNLDVEAEVVFDKVVEDEKKMSVGYDLTKLYVPRIKKAYREVTLIPEDETLVISDKITATGRFAKMDWTLMTESEPELVDGGVLLRKDGKTMMVSAETSLEGEWHFEEAVGDYSYDSPNPGVYRVRYTADLKVNKTNTIVVTFTKK